MSRDFSPKQPAVDAFFGGFDAVDNPTSLPDDTVFEGFAAVDGGGADDDVVDGGTESVVPAWYAGKISRDICEETVPFCLHRPMNRLH